MHRRTSYALGMGMLLVLSASITPVAALSGATATADRSHSAGDVTDAAAGVQTQSDAITALEAMEIARNGTNGTVVGVQRERAGGDNGTPAWEVKVVQGNRTGTDESDVNRRLLGVDVHATNGTIIGTQRETDQGGFFETDESTRGIAVSNTLNLSTTRSAVDATRIALNDSEAGNATVRGVQLTLRDQGEGNATNPALVYEIGVENATGERVIVVSARRGEEGVIAVESQQDGDSGG